LNLKSSSPVSYPAGKCNDYYQKNRNPPSRKPEKWPQRKSFDGKILFPAEATGIRENSALFYDDLVSIAML
jgi:hypothetical protein